MQSFPPALARPLAEAAPACRAASTAHLQWEQLPGKTGPENKEDAGEDLPVAHPRAATVLAHLALSGQERLDYRPERVIDEGSHALRTNSRYLLKRTLSRNAAEAAVHQMGTRIRARCYLFPSVC